MWLIVQKDKSYFPAKLLQRTYAFQVICLPHPSFYLRKPVNMTYSLSSNI